MALSRGIPCATVIGGGYDDDIDVLGRRHSIIHRAAIKVSDEQKKQWVEREYRSREKRKSAVRSFWCGVKTILFLQEKGRDFVFLSAMSVNF